jgi:hypothetical protein
LPKKYAANTVHRSPTSNQAGPKPTLSAKAQKELKEKEEFAKAQGELVNNIKAGAKVEEIAKAFKQST